MLQQDSPQSACLSATQCSCLGGKGQDEGGESAGYSLASQADTPRRRERQGGLGDSSEPLPESAFRFLCYYFLNSEVNRLETRCITEANNSWRLDGKNVMQRLHTKDRGFRLNPPRRFLLLLLSTLNHPESEWLPWGRGWKSPELENQMYF